MTSNDTLLLTIAALKQEIEDLKRKLCECQHCCLKCGEPLDEDGKCSACDA